MYGMPNFFQPPINQLLTDFWLNFDYLLLNANFQKTEPKEAKLLNTLFTVYLTTTIWCTWILKALVFLCMGFRHLYSIVLFALHLQTYLDTRALLWKHVDKHIKLKFFISPNVSTPYPAPPRHCSNIKYQLSCCHPLVLVLIVIIAGYLELLIYGYMTRNFTDQLSVSHHLSFTF